MTGYDVVVCGAGHAGVEAAAAAARLGATVALVTAHPDTVCRMSCNPAIGGLAKGQLAREVDALGGLMAQATDASSIHSQVLGTSKGPAMWSPRAQCDRHRYAAWMKHRIETMPGVHLLPGEVVDLTTTADGAIAGVVLRDGRRLRVARVVLTTGTFLDGTLHQGPVTQPGGRMGEAPARGLSDGLRRLGLRLCRLKTGTPPRLHANGIAWDLCTVQPPEPAPRPFAHRGSTIALPQVPCHLTSTTPESHAVIRANLARAPLFNGQITGIGPRYCPSIEDKVVRFADRERHRLILEPEGLDTDEIYVNGLATSLPVDVQDAMLAAIPSLATARVARHGYAVEYDAVVSDQLDHRLAVRTVPGLYCAGQINGTSGYEEAAIQGLVAGANAALSLAGDGRELRLGRGDAYGGVLIDDLVTRVPTEPYRMFTSRAEHRLHLRSDNADRRLVPLAAAIGLVDPDWAAAVHRMEAAISALVRTVPPDMARDIAGRGESLADTRARMPAWRTLDPELVEGAWIELRYLPYLQRQAGRLRRLERLGDLRLPATIDYAAIPALGRECVASLTSRRPWTLGEAISLPGVSESDLETIAGWLRAGGDRTAVI